MARKLLIESGTVPPSVVVPPEFAWSKLKYTRSVKFPIALGMVPDSALLYSPLRGVSEQHRQPKEHVKHAAARAGCTHMPVMRGLVLPAVQARLLLLP